MRNNLISAFLFFSSLVASATGIHIYAPTFKTVQTYQLGSTRPTPLLTLGSNDRFSICFDELADTHRYLRYEIIHCDASGIPDGLPQNRYINGINEINIDTWQRSVATTIPYIHYSATIPSDDIRLVVSGNYIVRVYDEVDYNMTLLEIPFQVSENNANINASVSGVTDIDYNRSHQQLKIEVTLCEPPTATSEIIVKVSKNGEYNQHTLNSPDIIEGSKFTYLHSPELIFPAGNEYRRFEIVSLQYPGLNVSENVSSTGNHIARLMTDSRRTNYSYDKTQNGRFTVRGTDIADSNIEADYIFTEFNLNISYNKEIKIIGDLTLDGNIPESSMQYDFETQAYRATLLLKQGSYNYLYSYSSANAQNEVEGDFYQTSNEYHISVYHRSPLLLHDRLLGSYTVSSTEK